MTLKTPYFLDLRYKKRRPWTTFFVDVVGRVNVNLQCMLLIFKDNDGVYLSHFTFYSIKRGILTQRYCVTLGGANACIARKEESAKD